MRSPNRRLRALRGVILVCAFSAPAWAQSEPTPPETAPALPSAPTILAPELIGSVDVGYPPAALQARLEGAVLLRLDIDATGSVTHAEVVESAGAVLDDAAQAAVLRFSFEPARRGEIAIASRILYRYEFHLPEVTVAPPAVPPVVGPATPAPPPSAPPAKERTPAETPVERAPGAEPAPVEVTVQGLSAADRKRQSAEAVTVVETELARRESADTGEVLARVHGIGVRRSGGLGSSVRFTLNGLGDEQVRFFLDGVPLELAGYPMGVANVPINAVDRIEVYSGVVPVRFGADALGGAVNLVSDQDDTGTHANASYEAGSFDTHRLTLAGRHLDEDTGFFARVDTFFDATLNDYPVNVEVPDERGRLSPARVYRFHDKYRALGVIAEAGVVRRPWARRLLLRAFTTDYDKDYQHNIVMTVPYGGVTYGETTYGVSARYDQPLGHGLMLETIAGYTYNLLDFVDVSSCVYDWFGRCVRQRLTPGETDTRPHDQRYWDHTGFLRINTSWRIHPQHTLRLAVAPTVVSRTGDELRQSDPDTRDPLSALRELTTLVNGLEYETDQLDDRLENIVFAKQYLQLLDSEEHRPGNFFQRRDRDTHRFGLGNSARLRLDDWHYLKLSYEWATRLPRPDEIFGDGAFIVANLELRPEVSHNANLSWTVDAKELPIGGVRGTINGFVRELDQLIVLIGNDRTQSYQNVFQARSLGVEVAAEWKSPGEYVTLGGNFTEQSYRNTSSEGTFGEFDGDRIPNRPYFFANAWTRLQARNVFAGKDELTLAWHSRYTREFFRGWESVGLREFKQVVPAQLVHSVALGYMIRRDTRSFSSTVEMQNVFDERVYDLIGAQRPGRAFYVKTTAEF